MFPVISKKNLLIALTVVLVIVVSIVAVCQTTLSQTFYTQNARLLPVYRVDRGEEKVVALSFDAAWGADKTQGIVDILNRYKVKATFFLVGFWIDKFENEVKMINKNGMEIGNHSRNHLKMTTLTEENRKSEIAYVNDNVYRLTQKHCKVFRAPFGDYNNDLMKTVESLGMIGVQWDVDSLDWKGLSADEIAKRVNSKVKSGSIVLSHNNSDHILEALPLILDFLTKEGYKFLTMSEMLYHKDYKIDSNGQQYKSN